MTKTELTYNISNDYRKYPGNLSVTVGSYKPELTRSVSLIRPMSVLEEEITGDIYTQGSDNEELETIHGYHDEEVDVKTQTVGKKLFVASHLETRLPGQVLMTFIIHIFNPQIQMISNPILAV